jgi:hypothetical protein
VNLETFFSIANATAMVGWLLLALLPRWRWSARLIGPVLIPILLALAYGALLVPNLFSAEGGFGSLAGVAQLFETPELLLAGWIHYLAFDLFIGSWVVRDAQRSGLPHPWVLPCLALTFLAGPIGLALYLGLRAAKKGASIDEAST